MAHASEESLRTELERDIPAGLPLVFEDQFPKLSGFRVRATNRQHLKALKAAAPLLERLLSEGERVHLVSRACVMYPWETLFMGAVAPLANSTLLVATDRRVLLIHATSKFEPYLYINQIPRSAIRLAKNGFLGSLSLRLEKGGVQLGWLKARDRKTLVRLYGADHKAQGTLQRLCPSCFHAHEEHVLQCARCGLTFRSPKTAALRSLLLPGLGDWYLGHRRLALLEIFGSMAGLGLATGLMAAGIAQGNGFLIGFGLVIVLFANGVDALLTHAQGKKGLIAQDGFLPSRCVGKIEARGPAATMQSRVAEVERHPAERIAAPWLGLFGVCALAAFLLIFAATQGAGEPGEYPGAWAQYGAVFEADVLAQFEDEAPDDVGDLSREARASLAKCVARSYVVFLNDSPCKPARGSDEASVAEQDACLERAQFAEATTRLAQACMQELGIETLATGELPDAP